MKREISIEGIVSGDSECWCILVDRETFKAVKGQYPEDIGIHRYEHEGLEYERESRGDVGRYADLTSPYKYMLYPSDLILDDDNGNCEAPHSERRVVKVSIISELK